MGDRWGGKELQCAGSSEKPRRRVLYVGVTESSVWITQRCTDVCAPKSVEAISISPRHFVVNWKSNMLSGARRGNCCRNMALWWSRLRGEALEGRGRLQVIRDGRCFLLVVWSRSEFTIIVRCLTEFASGKSCHTD